MGQVVDTQLRVYGTSRLRVIDNSIQPEIITTNTQSSALMIGEKGSDMILKYWAQAETEQHSQQQNHLNSNGGYSINPMSNPWWKNLIQQK
jgi:choline dehydrogenase-like flavoprotein